MTVQILIPLDGSSLAEQALSCAVTLGRELPAELILLRVRTVSPEISELLDAASEQTGAMRRQIEVEADQYLQKVANRLRQAGLSVRYLVRDGPPAETILNCAEEMAVGQIIMATHGYSGMKRWTHGSVAERVLQAASVPLLLVRAREASDPRPPLLCRRILVPLDGSRLAEKVLPAVIPMAQALGSKMILYRVLPVHASAWGTAVSYVDLGGVFEIADQNALAYLQDLASQLEEQGIRTHAATQTGAIAESIVAYAEDNYVDLIAMCTHGRTGPVRWALGSVADRVLRAGSIPMLLVRAR